MSKSRLSGFQKKLGYNFADAELLSHALTHTSWANENDIPINNERLEFLGDAVLELCISDILFKRFKNSREGSLTKKRSHLVNAKVLATLAKAVELDRFLRLGKGEEQQGGRQREALLADAMEAVLGGIYLDSGLDNAKAFIENLFSHHLSNITSALEGDKKDFKTRLQEETQRLLKSLPVYMLLGTEGPEHEKSFTVQVVLSDGRFWSACGPGLKRAEHEAAKIALRELGLLDESE